MFVIPFTKGAQFAQLVLGFLSHTVVNKRFNFCCFRALAYTYTTLDRLRTVFFSMQCIRGVFIATQLNSTELN